MDSRAQAVVIVTSTELPVTDNPDFMDKYPRFPRNPWSSRSQTAEG